MLPTQEVMELTIAAHAVNHRAARAMEETAIAREAAHCAHSHHEAAARRAGAAEAALAAAHTATQLAHAEAGTALVRIPPRARLLHKACVCVLLSHTSMARREASCMRHVLQQPRPAEFFTPGVHSAPLIVSFPGMAIAFYKPALHRLCCNLRNTCACVQEANRLLQAELDARVTTIRVLQSQVEDAASPTMTASTPGLLKPTATWLADQALEAFSHPLLSSEGATADILLPHYLCILGVKKLHICISTGSTAAQRLSPALSMEALFGLPHAAPHIWY